MRSVETSVIVAEQFSVIIIEKQHNTNQTMLAVSCVQSVLHTFHYLHNSTGKTVLQLPVKHNLFYICTVTSAKEVGVSYPAFAFLSVC